MTFPAYSLEHIALNVPDTRAAASWYVNHFKMTVKLAIDEPPYTHFLADTTGKILIELYSNPSAEYLKFDQINHLSFHLAFTVPDPESFSTYLQNNGASFVERILPKNGSVLLMLRDPWGIPIQLVHRTEPLR